MIIELATRDRASGVTVVARVRRLNPGLAAAPNPLLLWILLNGRVASHGLALPRPPGRRHPWDAWLRAVSRSPGTGAARPGGSALGGARVLDRGCLLEDQ